MTERDAAAAPPSPAQAALLDFLLGVPFTQRAEILEHRERFLYRSSCTCGCPSFTAHVEGLECQGRDWKLPPEAATFDEANPIEVMVFGCEQGLHVEIVDHLARKGLPVPSPDDLKLLVDAQADEGKWS